MMQFMFFMLLISLMILSWIGSCPVESPFIHIGQIFTTFFFLFFFMLPKVQNM